MTAIERFAAGLLTAMALLAMPATEAVAASLADGRIGTIIFEAPRMWGLSQVLDGTPVEDTVQIAGTLSLPAGVPGKVPAMVIIPDKNNSKDGRIAFWRTQMLQMGIATFVLDSFGPSGDKHGPTPDQRTADAYAALRLLATHPRIDAARIGIMGWGTGGFVAINTAFERVRWALTESNLRFAVHIALYPPCYAQWRTVQMTGAPVYFLLGASDDVAPAALCQGFAERIAQAGGTVGTVTFPGAQHGFDTDQSVGQRSSIFNTSRCNWRIADDGVWLDVNTDLRLTGPEAVRQSFNRCGFYGGTTGGSRALRSAAAAKIREFAQRAFFAR